MHLIQYPYQIYAYISMSFMIDYVRFFDYITD